MQNISWGDMSPEEEHTDSDDKAGHTTPKHGPDASLNDGRRVTIGDGITPQRRREVERSNVDDSEQDGQAACNVGTDYRTCQKKVKKSVVVS